MVGSKGMGGRGQGMEVVRSRGWGCLGIKG